MADSNGNILLSKSKILERGWTETLISRFLGEPELLKPNPYYKSASPMKLWSQKTVEEIEKTAEFQVAREKMFQCRASAARAAATKRAATIKCTREAIQSIRVVIINQDVLKRKALAFVRDRHLRQDGCFFSPEDAGEATIQRWMVNYIRHNLTKYDRILDSNFRKVGKFEVYPEIKVAVMDRIAEAYPYLKDECERQKKRMLETELSEDEPVLQED